MTNHPTSLLAAIATVCLLAIQSEAAPQKLPLPVWNQAYQENYEPDTLTEILDGAESAYVLLDPFRRDEQVDLAAVVEALHLKGNEVGAYISVGTGEEWRDDFEAFKPYLVDRQWDAWGGEYFVNQPNDAVMAVMKSRVDRIATWGFDWVEFDNMDWVYDDDNRREYGFQATVSEGSTYYRALCDYVHAKRMKCMAKSTVDDADVFDGVTYESYADDLNWWDEAAAKSFLLANKPVIIVHYDDADCDATHRHYLDTYGFKVSFICEDSTTGKYRHFNQL